MTYQYESPSSTGATGRTKLAAVAAICALLLAGCVAGSDNNANNQQPTNNAITANQLKITMIGGGAGSVTWSTQADGGGLTGTCASGTCFAPVPQGTVLTLTATPSGSTFAGWLGACSGTSSCSLTMDGDKFVGAAFSASGLPPVVVSVTGFGNVTSNVGGLNCGNGGTACSTEVGAVTLTATPNSGQSFLGWSGACASAGTNATCNLAGTAPALVTALFSGSMLRLDVVLTGAGQGHVASSPAPINCGAYVTPDAGAICGSPFTPGTQVVLTATAKDTNSAFSGWTGACEGAGNPCTVTLDDNKSVGAEFVKLLLGSAQVLTTPDAGGSSCTYGGTLVQAGMDANSNGTLDTNEITWFTWACNTSTAAAVVTQSPEPAGANCPHGGLLIQSSVDPTFTYYVCNNPGQPTANPGINATIVSVTPSTSPGPISVRFKLKDDLGNPISTAGTYSQNLKISPRFSLAYYTTDAGNDSPFTVYTQSLSHGYVSPSALTPSANGSTGTLTENGVNAGDYTYTFPTVTYTDGGAFAVQYDPAKTSEAHVLWIEAGRQTDLVNTINGTTFYAANQPYYFFPATGAAAPAREIVKKENCWKCHDTKFKVESTTTAEGVFHGGSRIDPTYCNICHNPGRLSNPDANSKNHVHRIHGAEALQPTNVFDGTGAFAFPQTTANCSACHGGAANGDQYKNVPTRQACGSCHDNVKFDQSASAVCSGAMTAGTAYTTGVALTITASTKVITRASGSFLTDGFAAGQAVAISGTASNNIHMSIASVTDTSMTLAGTMSMANETTPTTAYINAYSIPVICNHPAPAYTDDTSCASCHTSSDITTQHQPVAAPDPTFTWFDGGTNSYSSSAWVAASGQVPAGASVFSYDLQGVSTYVFTAPAWAGSTAYTAGTYVSNGGNDYVCKTAGTTAASGGPSTATYVDGGSAAMGSDITDGTAHWTYAGLDNQTRPQATFRILKDNARADFDGTTELYASNFMGSPSAYFAWSMPQDGQAAPTEFNVSASCYIRNAWNGTAGSSCTITGPDSNGYYTVQMKGGKPVPAGATMLTGGIGYTYGSTPPLTQTNLASYPVASKGGTVNGLLCAAPTGYKCGGLIVPVPDVWKVATGFTGRRSIVDNEKCKNCHGALGIEPNFHVGQRNNGPTCSFCHTPNQTSSAWPAASRYYIHAIHGGRVRTQPFTWHASSPGPGFGEVEYPSPLSDCQTCHLPGTNMLVNANSNLPTTVGAGSYSASFSLSPYVTTGTNYGAGYAVDGNTGLPTAADPTTLVISPIATVCSACHDAPNAIDHMRGKGARFYEPRSTYTAGSEQCMSCHAQLNH